VTRTITASASSRFTVPGSLTPRHAEELKKRGISADFAIRSGVRTAADNELRDLGFGAALPLEERKKGLQGICFEYRDLAGHAVSYRVKPDQTFSLNGKAAKYLSRAGDRVHAYFPHTTTPEMAANPKMNAIITEGEYKTLSIAENIIPICSRPTCIIGLQGVNGGWHRDKVTITLPDGTRETRKEGHAHLIDSLESWEWKKRTVYIVFDSDVGRKANATAFKQNKRLGAWGAEYTLAQLLRAQGAEVRIVILPPRIDGAKYGADDYIAARGAHEFLKLLYNNWVVDRDADDVLYSENRAAIKFESARDLVQRAPAKPATIIEKILPAGCVAVLAGAAGIGKSLILINACQAIATGGKFLDLLQCEQGRALYVQTEMPDWAQAERIKNLGSVNDNFLVWSPGASFPMNFWEPDGFNKRRVTGNRERVMALLDQIRSFGPRLVVFDPLKDFTTLSLSDPEAVKHLFQILRMIAVNACCGILVGHHHKKTGGREGKYEGMDDAYGAYIIQAEADSILSLYAEKRADETSRFKMLFSKLRHAAPMDPVEIDRMSGGNSFLWKAIPWEDVTRVNGKRLTNEDRLLTALENGRLEFRDALAKSGLKRATFFRTYDKLEEKGRVKRVGNVYFLPDIEGENGG
jgi:hypothetical protein